jgi:GNAT superfamily N-acetyltransferase
LESDPIYFYDVSDLRGHPGFVPALVDAFFDEWPQWCHRVGRPGVESIFEADPGGGLPSILVAHERGEPLGTVALRPFFAEEPMPESPWVRQLLVFPRYRGRGVDRALIAAVERRARDLGHTRLYAATHRIERLLARRGWETFATVEHEEGPMAWLTKAISAR